MKFSFSQKILLVIFVLGVVVFSVRLLSGEDSWICDNGQWVKHGQPSAPQPVGGCSKVTTEPSSDIKESIHLDFPLSGAEVASPLVAWGKATGAWYFEGVFPVTLMDKVGRTLAQGLAEVASGDNWMQDGFSSFSVNLPFVVQKDTDAFLVLERDNPSGLPENNAFISVPVRLKSDGFQNVKVFFGTEKTGVDCQTLSAVNRVIPKTTAVARAAILELLKGPTATEKTAGYFSSINFGVRLQKLTIVDGVARVDFSTELDRGVGGSCLVTTIRSQITQTLKQFSTVKEVVISINGRTEDILQP